MDDKVKLNPTEARQGRSGTQVLAILIGGLILALVVWWAVGLYGSAIEPEDPVGGTPTEDTQTVPGTEADE